MPTISLCAIAHNEEATMDESLASVQGLVDEYVIGVDSKSTDRTPEIAKKYASPGKLFEFDWRDDFSWARNQAIQRAEKDLILVLDMHEYVPPDENPVAQQLARMRRINTEETPTLTPLSLIETVKAQGIPDPFQVLCVTLCMNPDPWMIPGLFFLQPRIFHNDGNICYSNPVHNHLTGYDRDHAMGAPEGIVVHQMPPEREAKRKKQRSVMNFSGLMADVREERKKPKNEQIGRPWFYLGNSYADMGNSEKAIWWYEQYLDRSKFGEERYQALQQLALLYARHREDPTTGTKYVMEAMVLSTQTNNRRAEPFVLLGEIAQVSGDWDQAVHWFNLADQIAAPPTVMFLQGPVYSYMCDLKRMACYIQMENWSEAIMYGERALTWHPNDMDITQRIRDCKSHLSRTMPKDQNLLIIDNLGSFTEDLVGHFANNFNTVRRKKCDERWIGWSDFTWIEWCDENAIYWSRQEWHGPLVVRLHSYEALTDMPGQVNWDNVDALVCVAEHIKELVIKKWPHIQEKTKVVVIPNGVNTSVPFKERQPGTRVGYLGYLNHKKGVETLLELVRMYPEYDFVVGGEFQDGTLAWFAEESIRDLPNFSYKGWVTDKDEFFDEIDYLVSPSIIESFGYGIAEAALRGVKPLIRQRPGAEALWPSEWIWHGVEDFRRVMEGPYKSGTYRDWVVDHYSLENQFALTDALIDELSNIERPGLISGVLVENLELVTGDVREESEPTKMIR